MDSRELKIGDRVVGLENNIRERMYVNQIGTVIAINEPKFGPYSYRVKYDIDGAPIWSSVRPLTLLEKTLYEQD